MISIIIPVYNVEKYLNCCVDSVLAQTYKDFELILVDDGSSDNSGKICDEYAEKDSRICVIHKQNSGPSDSRNEGLDIAKGEYVYFVDSDDYAEPDLLEKIIPYMQEGCQLVSFGFIIESDNGNTEPFVHFTAGLYYRLKTVEERLDFITDIFMKYGMGFEVWNRVFDRSIIEKHNLRFEDNTIFAEDVYFSLCYLAHIEKIYISKDCPYHYCMRKDSIMSGNRDKFNLRRFDQLAQAVLNHYKESTSCQYLADNFPLIYLAVFEYAEKILKLASGKTDIRYIKSAIYEELSDTTFFRTNMRRLKKYKNNLLYKNSKKSYMYERLNILQYYSGSCYYLTALKNRVVISLASFIDR